MTRILRFRIGIILIGCITATLGDAGTRVTLRDILSVKGVRNNHLIGYGLVIGLAGGGDTKKSLVTNRAISTALSRFGLVVSDAEVVSGNVASVIVTGELPAFAKIGDRLDVRVSALADAKSLAGGTLLLTPLTGGDGKVYVVAQGGLIVGQATGQGAQVLTVANIPSGALVEREPNQKFVEGDVLQLVMKNPSFSNNAKVVDKINGFFRGFFGESVDASAINVKIPSLYKGREVEFAAELLSLQIDYDDPAIVVVNERTGTVVIGGEVVITPISVAHGKLTIQIDGKPEEGKDKKKGSVVRLGGSTVGDLVSTLNRMGVSPQDVIGILQSIHSSGAMQADLKVL